MTKVFLVTSGSYSDYGVDEVFSTRELAEHYCSLNDDCSIDERGLDNFSLDLVRKPVLGLSTVFVQKEENRQGHLLKREGVVEDGAPYGHICVLPSEDSSVSEINMRTNPGSFYELYCTVSSTISPAHAHKVCVERLQRFQAEKAGVA